MPKSSTAAALTGPQKKLALALQETLRRGMQSWPPKETLQHLESRLRDIEEKVDKLLTQHAKTTTPNGRAIRGRGGRVCMVPRCSNAHSALGFCNLHYQRWRAGKLKLKPKPVNRRSGGTPQPVGSAQAPAKGSNRRATRRQKSTARKKTQRRGRRR